MRPAREVTSEEENFRLEEIAGLASGGRIRVIKRDPVEPEPVGTIVLMAFRVVGYDPDCDGSLMAQLERIDKDGETTGWCPDRIGIYPDTDLVVTMEELRALFASSTAQKS